MAEQLSSWAAWLKRGDLRDPEDHRLTYRLGLARAILREQGIEPTWAEHAETCILHPRNGARRMFGVSYRCECGRPTVPTWPEWVTDGIFNAAMVLADKIQTERGNWHKREAGRAKLERQAAAGSVI